MVKEKFCTSWDRQTVTEKQVRYCFPLSRHHAYTSPTIHVFQNNPALFTIMLNSGYGVHSHCFSENFLHRKWKAPQEMFGPTRADVRRSHYMIHKCPHNIIIDKDSSLCPNYGISCGKWKQNPNRYSMGDQGFDLSFSSGWKRGYIYIWGHESSIMYCYQMKYLPNSRIYDFGHEESCHDDEHRSWCRNGSLRSWMRRLCFCF